MAIFDASATGIGNDRLIGGIDTTILNGMAGNIDAADFIFQKADEAVN